jgi:hypothetical protein
MPGCRDLPGAERIDVPRGICARVREAACVSVSRLPRRFTSYDWDAARVGERIRQSVTGKLRLDRRRKHKPSCQEQASKASATRALIGRFFTSASLADLLIPREPAARDYSNHKCARPTVATTPSSIIVVIAVGHAAPGRVVSCP